MSKKEDKFEFYCLRKGQVLQPEMAADLEYLETFPQGERIKVALSSGRNPSRLRWYWAFLKKVIDATEAAPDVEAMHQVVKLATGYVVEVTAGDYKAIVPRSISFASMPEEEFVRFVANAEKFIASAYGITPEDVFKGE